METERLQIVETDADSVKDLLFDVPVCTAYFLICEKENGNVIGCTGFCEKEDSVMSLMLPKMFESLDKSLGIEAAEGMLNQMFYRINARKVQASCFSNSVFEKDLLEEFGFHFESSKEMIDENEVQSKVECWTLFKEEYISYLRRKGKTLGFLRLPQMRVVFLGTALIGLVLLGVDISRGVSTIVTACYAYFTGIGVAGAFACSWLMMKNGSKGDHHAG